MKAINFAKRSFIEIIRDPLSLIFAILLPLFLLIIFQQINIPIENYKINYFTPGIIIFAFSFISLFTATLVAKDRSSSLLIRLGISPMRGSDFTIGYILALLPVAIIQNILFLGFGMILGLKTSIGILYSFLISMPIAVLFITLGIIVGSLVSEKAASGVSSIIIQLVAFTSGMYFESAMLGDGFNIVCEVLPFKSANDILKGFINASYDNILKSIIIVFVYLLLSIITSSIIFNKKRIK